MSTDPITPDTPGGVATIKPPPTTYLYLRIQDRMQQLCVSGLTEFSSPVAFIAHHRRVDEGQAQPLPFYTIASALSELTGITVTHESIRRWYRRGVPVGPATP